MEKPLAASARHKHPEHGPKILHVLSMCSPLRPPIRLNSHSQRPHHCLQSALHAESIQVVGIRPTLVREEQLCILPVSTMGICEIGGIRHCRARLTSSWAGGVRSATLASGGPSMQSRRDEADIQEVDSPFSCERYEESCDQNHTPSLDARGVGREMVDHALNELEVFSFDSMGIPSGADADSGSFVPKSTGGGN